MRNIEGKNKFTSGKKTSELYLSLVLVFVFFISATPSLSKSLLSQLYHENDESRINQYNEYLTYEGKTYNSYDWIIEALSAIDHENGEFQRSFEIAKFLLGEDKEAGFDILEFLYEVDIHENTNDPIVIEIYLLFAEECEKRGIYDAAARAYEVLANIYNQEGDVLGEKIMHKKAKECFKKGGDMLFKKIDELDI